jgi:hypothetical protein
MSRPEIAPLQDVEENWFGVTQPHQFRPPQRAGRWSGYVVPTFTAYIRRPFSLAGNLDARKALGPVSFRGQTGSF